MKKIIFSFLLILSVITVGFSATLSQLRDDIRSQLKDNNPTETNRRWSDTLLNFRINQIQTNISEETRCLIARISTHTIANQREYAFPSDMIAPIRLAYHIHGSTPPAYKKLEFYIIGGLDNENANWENLSAGLPTKYYEFGDKYGLHPKPSAVYTSTYAVQIDYYQRAADMTADSDIPFNGYVLLYPFHKILILGTVIWCRGDQGLEMPNAKTEYYILLGRLYESLRKRKDDRGGSFTPIPVGK